MGECAEGTLNKLEIVWVPQYKVNPKFTFNQENGKKSKNKNPDAMPGTFMFFEMILILF
jgi:hypothetical protein